MNKKVLIGAIVVVIILLGVYILGRKEESTQTPGTNTNTTSTPPETAVEVKTGASTPLGRLLTDSEGKTLYLYTKDELGKSNCEGQCAQNWPPLLSIGAPSAGTGATGNLLSTITRSDGTKQVSYNGWPLYYFARDSSAGETNGQNVGKVWFAISPEGAPIYTNASLGLSGTSTKYIVDASGRSLYMFTADKDGKSSCNRDCAQKWPPFLTVGKPLATGINQSLITTTTRSDGSVQIMYNKLPLYYWWKDVKPGDTLGQRVGNVWFLVSPSGTPIR